MSVAQLVKHVGTHYEQLLSGHLAPYSTCIFIMHLVPVHPLFFEEAVVLVKDAPQGFEIASRIIGTLLYLMAGGQPHKYG